MSIAHSIILLICFGLLAAFVFILLIGTVMALRRLWFRKQQQ